MQEIETATRGQGRPPHRTAVLPHGQGSCSGRPRRKRKSAERPFQSDADRDDKTEEAPTSASRKVGRPRKCVVAPQEGAKVDVPAAPLCRPKKARKQSTADGSPTFVPHVGVKVDASVAPPCQNRRPRESRKKSITSNTSTDNLPRKRLSDGARRFPGGLFRYNCSPFLAQYHVRRNHRDLDVLTSLVGRVICKKTKKRGGGLVLALCQGVNPKTFRMTTICEVGETSEEYLDRVLDLLMPVSCLRPSPSTPLTWPPMPEAARAAVEAEWVRRTPVTAAVESSHDEGHSHCESDDDTSPDEPSAESSTRSPLFGYQTDRETDYVQSPNRKAATSECGGALVWTYINPARLSPCGLSKPIVWSVSTLIHDFTEMSDCTE